MNTQLFIKKDYTNLVLNPRFSPAARQYWETVDENSNACGSTFDILNTGYLHLGIPDAACQWAAGLLTVNQVFYPNNVSYIQRGTRYNVKVIIDNLSQPDPLNSWYIKVNLGGNDSIELSTEGYHSFQVVSGQDTNVSLIAFNFEDSNIGLDITYFEITEDRDYEIELKETESIPLTFNIADIKDPSKRKSSFSKSIKLPGTKGNNRVFGHFFEIEGESKFNPAKKLDCYLMQDGFVIFDGILQLEKVIRLNGSDSIEYEILLSGNLANIYTEWSDLKLNELDFSEYDHVWSRENQIKSIDEGLIKKDNIDYQSWNIGSDESFLDTFYDTDGYLGLDFGVGNPGVVVGDTILIEMTDLTQNTQYNGWFKVLKRPVGQVVVNLRFGDSTLLETGTIKKISPKGEGYCYPRIHYGDQIGSVYAVTDLPPALYAKQILDTAFNVAEFSYESEFLNSDYFRSLIIPADLNQKGTLTNDEILARLFSVYKNTTTSSAYTTPVDYDTVDVIYEDETPPASDPNNLYDNTLGTFNVPAAGNYVLNATLSLTLLAVPDSVPVVWGPGASNGVPTTIEVKFIIYKNTYDPANFLTTQTVSITFPANDLADQITSLAGREWNLPGIGVTCEQVLEPGDVVKTIFEWRVLYDGDLLGYEGYFNDGASNTVDGQLTMKSYHGQLYNSIPPYGVENTTINLSQTLPSDIKVADYFSSLVKTFNLLVLPDPDNDRNLFIEPRDSFYTSDIVDWTYKLDLSKDLEILPLASEIKKKYIYKYKDDGDFWNKNYQDSIRYGYGEYQITTDTDFNTDESKTELIFSPTPLVGRRGNPIYTDNLILSRITKDLGSNETIKSNLRLLYLGGQRIPANSSYYISSVTASTPVELYPQYTLYAGHLDQPLVPTIDLNFWQPFWTYFRVDQWTTGNLFNTFHRNQLLDTIDRDAKLVTAYFYLKPSDIKNLDFRKQIFVDGSYYRLNKITDYNGATPGLTKVELIRFNSERPPFVPTTKPSNGGVDVENPDTVGPIENRLPIIDVNGNQASNAQQIILDNSFDNIVDSNANKISFFNSNNNRIVGNRTNVVLINSDNLTIDEDNVTYIDGIKQSTLLSSSVQTVTGPNVDNTDPQNPVVNNELTSDQQDAIDGALAPDASNPFATIKDITNSFSASGVFVFINSASDIATFKNMPALSNYTPAAEANSGAITTTTTATVIGKFATVSGSPNVTILPTGLLTVHFETEKVTNSHQYYCYAEIYKCNSTGGSPTLICTTENSTPTQATARTQQIVQGLLNSFVTLSLTDRLQVIVYAKMVTGSNDITMFYDGTTSSGLRIPVPNATGGGSSTFTGLTDVPSSYSGQANKSLKVNAGQTGLEFFNPKGSINLTIDGSGGNIVPGDGGCVTMPYSGIITGWSIAADVSGSIVIDVWKDTYTNYPPVVGDSIAGTEKPTLSSQIKNQDLTLTTWTTAVSEGDIIKFNVDSSSTVNKVYLTIYINKTS